MGKTKIAVIGAGIMGMSSAFVLKRDHPEYDVTIIAENVSPDVTSDGAPGYWYPGNTMGSTPWELQERWALGTRDWLKEIYKQSDSYQNGVSLCSGYIIDDHYPTLPQCAKLFPDFRIVTKEEMARFPVKAKVAFFLTTFVCESSKYLPFLFKRYKALGGKVLRRTINSFDEVVIGKGYCRSCKTKIDGVFTRAITAAREAQLQDYDVIVNCTGLFSQKLCGDKEVFPIRGQILRVKAPWIRHFYRFEVPSEEKYVYIFPNNDFCVLGGTTKEGDYNLNAKEEDRNMILEETGKLEPSVKNAEIVCDWVGLRPGRTQVRLEKEIKRLSNGKELTIVHNYGHGRNGITMHFGCALHVKDFVEELLCGNEKKSVFASRL